MVRPTTRATPRRWTDDQNLLVYRLVSALTSLLLRVWVRYFRAVGAENLPSTGGAFLVANHTSGLDPFLLGVSVPQRVMTGPGKVELFKNPLVAWVMRRIGIFPLQQGVADTGAVRTMIARFRQGDIVIVYPEGGRSRTGSLQPFNPDFTRLVLKLRAPVIPAGIAGARDVLPVGELIPHRNTAVAVVIGSMLDLAPFEGRTLDAATLQEATAVLEAAVSGCLDEADKVRQELAPPQR
ncbi:MAG TPA: lysophospholipid acyltransferase family protein [Chloroflexota bacterium]|nr:lysophospholipid acyltransferase family protein [Chloroflexota bacterium]